jgi:glycosyltransferase involved in cell wall biosynthesis
VEYLSLDLASRGHDVTVYAPHYHPFQESQLKKVKIKRFYCPENKVGGAAHYLYDYLCLSDAVKNGFDIIYEAGYGSSAFSIRLLKNKSATHRIVTNMDGIEWQRSKWNRFVKYITRISEKIAVAHSDYVIADNIGIQKYYIDSYGVTPVYLPYGAEIVGSFDETVLAEYGLAKSNFYLIIARLEPENNLEMMIEGYLKHKTDAPLIIIGGTSTKYAQFLLKKYGGSSKVRFLGGLYNKRKLDNLRFFSRAYFHGHSVGGTNPSLLEAMGCSALIISHNNQFNRSVLNDNALFFSSQPELTAVLDGLENLSADDRCRIIRNNVEEIASKYNWTHVVDMHEHFFKKIMLPGN